MIQSGDNSDSRCGYDNVREQARMSQYFLDLVGISITGDIACKAATARLAGNRKRCRDYLIVQEAMDVGAI